jgi:hypothetical protein
VTDSIEQWEHDFDSLRSEWAALEVQQLDAERAEIEAWDHQLQLMQAETAQLRRDGQWLGGSRTLLHALKLEHSELVLTAGLAWLLDPENFHQLGEGVLDGFLKSVCAEPPTALHPVLIRREEPRNQTRADLIVRVPGTTVLVESKTGAGEQPDQCTRLAFEWADEAPVLVFLTRDRRAPQTAGDRTLDWTRISWADIARIVEAAVDALPPGRQPAPGVLDYLDTLRHFHGESI